MKIGDKVKFNGKFGLEKYYPEDVFTIVSEPWTMGNIQFVKLEGYGGGFRVEGLEVIEKEKDPNCGRKNLSEYERGLADAWEAAKEFHYDLFDNPNMTQSEVMKKYGFEVKWGASMVDNFFGQVSASEAIKNIRNYKNERKVLRVGDEVKFYDRLCGIIYRIDVFNTRKVYSIFVHDDDRNYKVHDGNSLEKTGRTFPEIKSIMKRI